MGSSQSTLRKFSTAFVWTIENISKILSPTSVVECLNYSFNASPDKEDLQWKLGLHPFGDRDENRNYVSLFLSLDKSYKLSVEANIKFTIMNASLEESSFSNTTEKFTFLSTSQSKNCNSVGFSQFIERSKILDKSSKLIKDD
ncbi:SPOPL.2 family protein [Megaselia abdita]